MDKDLPASVWEGWELVEKIGEGSYGQVYKAEHSERGNSFYSAIKVLSIPHGKNELNGVLNETGSEAATRNYFEGLLEDCVQEIKMMELFRGNSHVVSVEDYKVVEYLDEIGWDIYIRMEYLESFTEYCAGRNLSEAEVVKLGIDLCRALEYCSKLNIIHRDVKPENIFVSRFGDFKLGDFGIARQLEASMSSLSKKGTYSYMAPEMYRGEKYDNRVDICSLGLVMYKLLNFNRLPFLNMEKQLITYRDKESALARRMSGEKPAEPLQCTPELAGIVLKACDYEADQRYQTAEEFRKALEWYEKKKECESEERDRNAERKAASDEKRLREHAINASRKKRVKKRISSKVLIPLISLLVILFCIGVGVYVKVVLEEAVRKQSQELLELLGKSEPDPRQVDDFSDSIQRVKDEATDIVTNIKNYDVVGKENDVLKYYDADDSLAKVLVYPERSYDGRFEEYYYWDEELFFAYIWSSEGGDEEMFYYDEGVLIRWIEGEDACHDNEYDNPEYVSKGDKYWENALQWKEGGENQNDMSD
ncbi:MAG: serine/threonine protein kinase [Blautia sp.]|mgnify:CR=1 FL=1|nr:serine/threonine protein kinase [Blautia sp.]